ncbi:MAG TPA: pyrimidine/purine nucleoside phosphorylase [Terriglobales bacterium]|nr:pyrimidine/purine nucleoside phosphorylase [Terriglobales bacterium]
MASQQTERIEAATVVCKANIYFDGKVVSHTVLRGDRKQTVGLIYPGTFTFNTAAAERMDIIAGNCRVRIAGGEWQTYGPGTAFEVAAQSSFDIAVDEGITEYLCSFQ